MPEWMNLNWEAFEKACLRFAPENSVRRKILQLLSIILIFEGISVLILFSYDSAFIGVASLAIGLIALMLFYPKDTSTEEQAKDRGATAKRTPPGIRLLDRFMDWIGEPSMLSLAGIVFIIAVLVFNYRVSSEPKIGDLDTLSLIFGATMILYPFARRSYKIEASFCLYFLGLVVLILVVPQTLTALSSGAGHSAGGFYVHYMLAEPFAGVLNLLGISASSVGDQVTIVFRDGSANTLSISAYCAGLYSFSIFVSAFISFVLVFERLPARITTIVLATGLVAAYLGNVFRMVVIGVIGYYDGLQALLWAHANIGWMIFLGWSSVFWFLVMRFANNSQSWVQVEGQ